MVAPSTSALHDQLSHYLTAKSPYPCTTPPAFAPATALVPPPRAVDRFNRPVDKAQQKTSTSPFDLSQIFHLNHRLFCEARRRSTTKKIQPSDLPHRSLQSLPLSSKLYKNSRRRLCFFLSLIPLPYSPTPFTQPFMLVSFVI